MAPELLSRIQFALTISFHFIFPFLDGRTTLLISHRPSFTQLADTTVALERGRVVAAPEA